MNVNNFEDLLENKVCKLFRREIHLNSVHCQLPLFHHRPSSHHRVLWRRLSATDMEELHLVWLHRDCTTWLNALCCTIWNLRKGTCW